MCYIFLLIIYIYYMFIYVLLPLEVSIPSFLARRAAHSVEGG